MERRTLPRADGGVWTRPKAAAECDYAFIIDGGHHFPTALAMAAPGSSWTVANCQPRRFAWTDHHFNAPPLSSAIIYELHIGTFTAQGTFQSAIARLDIWPASA